MIHSKKVNSSYLKEDLVDENDQLRREVKRLSSLLVIDIDDQDFNDENCSSSLESSVGTGSFDPSIMSANSISHSSSTTGSKYPHSFHKLLDENENLRNEVSSLQQQLQFIESHSKSQAVTIKALSEKLDGLQHEHHIMESDLLEVFPLRLKVRELEKVLKGHNELIVNIQLENRQYAKQIEGYANIEKELCAQAQTAQDMKVKLSYHQAQEQELRSCLSDQLKKVSELNQLINKNQQVIERREMIEGELCKEAIQLKRQVEHLKKEKIALQFNHDIEKDQLHEELYVLQSKLKLREEAIALMTEQSKEMHTNTSQNPELVSNDETCFPYWTHHNDQQHELLTKSKSKQPNQSDEQEGLCDQEETICRFFPSLY